MRSAFGVTIPLKKIKFESSLSFVTLSALIVNVPELVPEIVELAALIEFAVIVPV